MKNRNFVNLNINPCKMCMPMGAVMAFKGIENSMMILHGSQGCSTYIRRHMAGHFNEPIDVASTSLSEEGTVYGGEKNLKVGLRNIINMYNPEVVGIATTCLAETIGEDIKRIADEFEDEEVSLVKGVEIVTVATPGYGGTQFEGYHAALLSIIKKLVTSNTKNNKINVIVPNLNPGDVRNIKEMLNLFNIEYILFPDVSDTLDSPYKKEYSKIPEGGTKLCDIELMGGAQATIEMGLTVPVKFSPGQYLLENFGVPLHKCTIPIGIGNTDSFLEILSKLSTKQISKKLSMERGRLLDGMIDSHKYNGEGRAVIYGDPEQVFALSKCCIENGIKPVLVSTGSQNPKLKELFLNEKYAREILVIDDTDFETIQKYAVDLKANILIGNSNGKVITEKENIPLVRYGFPVHDRVGGQRIVFTGYAGTQRLLDEITNTLLDTKYSGYRKKMFENYYEKEVGGEKMLDTKSNFETSTSEESAGIFEVDKTLVTKSNAEMQEKTANHPCYSSGASNNARMHIPVAPGCNISCNYCNRKYDCQNESRPGVTSEVLSPEEALAKFLYVKQKLKNLKVIGIAGPGDALANFENTKKSIELIREADKEITFCLSTNGLMLPTYAEDILKLGVHHITVTINAIDPVIAAKIYKEINYMGKKLVGIEAAEVLIKNQLEGLEYLTKRGAVVKVNIVMIKGVNDAHIPEVVKKVKERGAFMTNIMPLIPAEGSAFSDLPQTNNRELQELRKKCEIDLKQMYHCKQCRADAIGILEQDRSSEFRCTPAIGCGSKKSYEEEKPLLSESFEALKILKDVSIRNKEILGNIGKSFQAELLEGTKNFQELTGVNLLEGGIANTAKESDKIYKFAIASKSGIMVDEHFGHVSEFYIYKYENKEIRYLEKRKIDKYCNGIEECESEESKIDKIVNTILDCDAVIVLRIGYNPQKILEAKGIGVIQTCASFKEAVEFAVNKLKSQKNNLENIV